MTLEERMDAFKNKVFEHQEKYGRDMCECFFNYWAEPDDDGVMYWEEVKNKSKKKRFVVSLRMSTWQRNEKKWGKKKDNELPVNDPKVISINKLQKYG